MRNLSQLQECRRQLKLWSIKDHDLHHKTLSWYRSGSLGVTEIILFVSQ